MRLRRRDLLLWRPLLKITIDKELLSPDHTRPIHQERKASPMNNVDTTVERDFANDVYEAVDEQDIRLTVFFE
jgi:hypothetical protein